MALEGEYEPSAADYARDQVALYEQTNGQEGGDMKGRPVVILTMRGAKTGKIRKTPVMRVEHDGKYAVVASLGGAPQNPQWYQNLKSHPRVELQDGTDRREYEAREIDGQERDAWWDRAVEAWPDYAEYQTKTTRRIPVFVLDPTG